MEKTALIISTYNWPEALNLCMTSVSKQNVLPDELIIADDGSAKETRQLINEFSESSLIPVKHIWHEDKGFRLSKIRNLAIKNVESDYLIFVDGDIILHSDFVKDHIKSRVQNTFVTGSRVLLSEKESQKRIKNGNTQFSFFLYSAKNKLNGIRNYFLSKIVSKNDTRIFNVRGCNMAFWKKDLIDVNGFDEQFSGWGREDSDIVVRLLNSGKSKTKLKFAAIQFHLYHKEQDRSSMKKNELILKETISQNRIKSVIGLEQL